MGKDIKFKSIVVLAHIYATGPSLFLEDYLKDIKIDKLLFIGLPFSYAKDKNPFYRYYESGVLVDQKKINLPKFPEIIVYFRDIVLTLWWVISKGRFDLIVSADNLNTFSAIILRSIKKVNRVVFYTIDFVPHRFSNKILNSIYHVLEKLAVYKSDVVWNLSSIMQLEREKRGYDKKYSTKQIVVPIGTQPVVKLKELTEKQRTTVVFMGHLREGQGVLFLIEAFQKVLKKMPQLTLKIIGGGVLEPSLKKLVKKLKVENRVFFTGFVKDFKEVKNILSESGLAVAPYEDEEKSFTKYTDPGKVKDYLSQGLPVIVTKVPQVAFEVDKRGAGIAISNEKEELVDAMVKILSNKKIHDKYRRNALKMANDYKWEKLFENALIQTKKICQSN